MRLSSDVGYEMLSVESSGSLIFLAIALFLTPAVSAKSNGAFDEYGYNYQARIFNGRFGNADENRPAGDGNPDTYFGDSTNSFGYYDEDGVYHQVLINVADSHLVMKWSKGWHMAVFGPDNERGSGDEEPWGPGAWCTNHVEGTGTVYDTDGTTVIYQGHVTVLSKICWVGDTSDYTNPIWGTMAVVHKVFLGQGIVFHETPAGFGANP